MNDSDQSFSTASLQWHDVTEPWVETPIPWRAMMQDESSGAEGWGISEIRLSLGIAGTLLRYVADSQGVIAGYFLARHICETVELFYIYVAPSQRRHGLGRSLLTNLCEQARLWGNVERVFLEVRPSNAPALALYRSLGFQQTGMRKGYYRNGEDAQIWEWKVPR